MANKHIVLFPFMAQGHMIPFLALAKHIEKNKQYNITLVSTPLNILKLRSTLPPSSTINLIDLPFPSSLHGLPPGSENTDSLPLHLFLPLFLASESLQPSFEFLISTLILQHGRDNLCIVGDMFLGWTADSAKKLGVFHSVFVTSGAYGCAIIFSLWLNPPQNLEDSSKDEFPLVDFPEVKLHRSQIMDTVITLEGDDPVTAFLRRQLLASFRSNGVVVNTVEEFEKEGVKLLKRFTGLPVWCIRPLSRLPSSAAGNVCIGWLNSKPPASVLYVSFGSQNSINSSQMMDLALGLEASGSPFIWVIRPPLEFEGSDEFKPEWLPEGFEERIEGRKQGILLHKWAPQLEILSHSSTGAFLSHCGWNSVVESLSCGVPIIGWPLMGDQIYNSKMMVEKGVCVEMARGRNGCDGWEGVARAVEMVMGGMEKGREMRRKAVEIREMMKRAAGENGSCLKATEDFLQTAFSGSK